jgi:hypothetical protein
MGIMERRNETRMLCADVIEVCWKEGLQRMQVVALLEDISPGGACLQMESPIPIGSEIIWNSPEQRFTGIVRYCAYREIGYFIGVEFAEGVRWNEEEFEPQHLLNVEELARIRRPTVCGLTIQ